MGASITSSGIKYVFTQSTAPTSGMVEGSLWYDTTTNVLWTYDGATWNTIGAGTNYATATITEPQHEFLLDSAATDTGGGTALTLTAGASVAYDTTNKKFGSASWVGTASANEEFTHATYLDGMKTNYTNGWTMGFFFRPTNVAGDSFLVTKRNDANNQFFICFYGSVADKVEFNYKVGGSAVSQTPNKALSVNTWYYLAMSVSADGDVSVHVVESDGTTTTLTDSSLAAMMADGTTEDFTLGMKWDSSGAFEGQIDTIEIYDRNLTTAEITALGSRSVVTNDIQVTDTIRVIT